MWRIALVCFLVCFPYLRIRRFLKRLFLCPRAVSTRSWRVPCCHQVYLTNTTLVWSPVVVFVFVSWSCSFRSVLTLMMMSVVCRRVSRVNKERHGLPMCFSGAVDHAFENQQELDGCQESGGGAGRVRRGCERARGEQLATGPRAR